MNASDSRISSHPNFDSIPEFLKQIPQWCVWRYETEAGRSKPSKVPYQAKVSGKTKARSNDQKTWATFETSRKRYEKGGFDGVGFFLSETDGFTGIDLDGCFDEQGALKKPEAKRIVSLFAPDAYWEISPSGKGLRCFVIGKPGRSGKGKKSNNWIEVYSHPSSRFLTVTGKPYQAGSVLEDQKGLDRLHDEFMRDAPPSTPTRRESPPPVGFSEFDDGTLIAKAHEANDGGLFASLWSGDSSSQGGDDSRADLVLCDKLAFWTGCDSGRMDSLFRQSGLYREKWDLLRGGKTYGEMTISKAISRCTQTYTPPPFPPSRSASPTGGGRMPRARKEVNGQRPTPPTPARDDKVLRPTPSLHQPTPAYTREISRGVFEDGDDLIVESKAAEVLSDFMRNRYAFESSGGVWFEYRITHWQAVADSAIDRMAVQAMRRGCGETGYKKNYLVNVIDLVKKSGDIPLPEISRGMISFQNGMLNPSTGELLEVTPYFADTWCLPHFYNQSIQCPLFQSWLSYVTASDEDDGGVALMIQAFIAAILTGRADLQRFIFMEGPGGTGKSTFQRLIQAMIGSDNFEITDLRNMEQNRFETSRFYGKRLIIVTDSDRYGGSVNVLKALTGQDPIRNEKKNVQAAKGFIYGGMVLMAGNETLQTTDYTSGLSRRQIVIRFDRTISDAERMRFVASGGEEAMHREIPGIINWALELDRDRVTDIFKCLPASVTQSTFEASTKQNPLIGWVTANVVPNRDRVTRIGYCTESNRNGRKVYEDAGKKLYPNYLVWCRNTTRHPITHNRFSELLMDVLQNILKVNVSKGRDKHGFYVKGIEINPMKASRQWHELEDAEGTGEVIPDEYDAV